jgi:CheY-like chemotaxis protein
MVTGAGTFVEEALRWLPEEDAEAASELPSRYEALPVPAPGADADRPLVLVADDNGDMRQYIVRLLSEKYRVVAVPDGEAALAAAREQAPELVLTDVMMPRLDGFGLLAKLRGDPLTREVPVIMLSARAGEESRVEGMEAGVDDYLIKPSARASSWPASGRTCRWRASAGRPRRRCARPTAARTSSWPCCPTSSAGRSPRWETCWR